MKHGLLWVDDKIDLEPLDVELLHAPVDQLSASDTAAMNVVS